AGVRRHGDGERLCVENSVHVFQRVTGPGPRSMVDQVISAPAAGVVVARILSNRGMRNDSVGQCGSVQACNLWWAHAVRPAHAKPGRSRWLLTQPSSVARPSVPTTTGEFANSIRNGPPRSYSTTYPIVTRGATLLQGYVHCGYCGINRLWLSHNQG